MKTKFLALTFALFPFVAQASGALEEKEPAPTPLYDAVNTMPPRSKQQIFDQIIVTEQWLRQPSATSVNTAAYFNITNNTDKDMVLNGVISENDLCEVIEVHGYKDDKEVKKMFKLESVAIPAHSTIEFAPGSFHVMLMGLKRPIMQEGKIMLKFKLAFVGGSNLPIIPLYPVLFTVK